MISILVVMLLVLIANFIAICAMYSRAISVSESLDDLSNEFREAKREFRHLEIINDTLGSFRKDFIYRNHGEMFKNDNELTE